jgi:DNA-3-methyladenine glycosylase II
MPKSNSIDVASTTIDTQAALYFFKDTDPIMYELLSRGLTPENPIAIPSAKPPERYFESIVASIISQQISTKAADAVRGRVTSYLGTITPANVAAADPEALRSCGLSAQKVRYLTHNATVWDTLATERFPTLPDEVVIAELTTLYGIGRWTAEMFLIFSLARPNVFSYGDLGLMLSLYQHYQFRPHWRRKIKTTVTAWAPHQTAASLALWYARDNGPVLL